MWTDAVTKWLERHNQHPYAVRRFSRLPRRSVVCRSFRCPPPVPSCYTESQRAALIPLHRCWSLRGWPWPCRLPTRFRAPLLSVSRFRFSSCCVFLCSVPQVTVGHTKHHVGDVVFMPVSAFAPNQVCPVAVLRRRRVPDWFGAAFVVRVLCALLPLSFLSALTTRRFWLTDSLTIGHACVPLWFAVRADSRVLLCDACSGALRGAVRGPPGRVRAAPVPRELEAPAPPAAPPLVGRVVFWPWL